MVPSLMCQMRARGYHGPMDRDEQFAGVEDVAAESTGWFAEDQAAITDAAIAEAGGTTPVFESAEEFVASLTTHA